MKSVMQAMTGPWGVSSVPPSRSPTRFGAASFVLFVIPGIVPGIHLTPHSGVCCALDPGNKCRDDNLARRPNGEPVVPLLDFHPTLLDSSGPLPGGPVSPVNAVLQGA